MLQATHSTTDFESDKKLRMYYQSCTDQTLREKLGVKPLQKMLKRLGGWPVLEGDHWSHGNSFRWYDHVLKMASKGYYETSTKAFFNYRIQTVENEIRLQLEKPQQSQRQPMQWCNLLQPLSPRPGAAPEHKPVTFDDEPIHQYYEIMVKAAIQLGADEAEARNQLKEVVNLMIEIYNVNPCSDWDDEPLLTTLGEAEKVIGGPRENSFHPSSWTSFFADWLKPFGIHIGDENKLKLEDLDYVKNVLAILAKYANRQKVLANYFGWLIVEEDLKHLNKKSQSIALKLARLECTDKSKQGWVYSKLCKQKYGGQWSSKARTMIPHMPDMHKDDIWKWVCFNWKEEYPIEVMLPSAQGGWGQHTLRMDILVDSMYVRKYHNLGQRPRVISMLKGIRETFYRILKRADWMDKVTNEKMIERLDHMEAMISYPDELTNETLIDGYYKGNVCECTYPRIFTTCH